MSYLIAPTLKVMYVMNFLMTKENIKHISAHVIVARAFLGEPKSSDLTPDHINREPADNRLVNLRWATQKQQVANSDRSTCKPRGQPVIQYTMDMKEIKRWINITTAAKGLGIHKGSIGQTCQEKRGHAGGFKWVYERQDLDGEIWKEYIHGTKFHESVEGVTDALSLKPMGAVQVSNMGRIKSSHHIIYGSKIGDYLTYGRPGKFVHVMVAKVFIPNPENKPEVNHLDLDTTNNKVENLEWVTSSENKIHSNKTNSNPDRYSTAKAVNQYISFSSGANVEVLPSFCVGEYRSIGEASRQTKCSQTSIRDVCLGLSESTKGYVFKYADEDVSNLPSTKTC